MNPKIKVIKKHLCLSELTSKSRGTEFAVGELKSRAKFINPGTKLAPNQKTPSIGLSVV